MSVYVYVFWKAMQGNTRKTSHFCPAKWIVAGLVLLYKIWKGCAGGRMNKHK